MLRLHKVQTIASIGPMKVKSWVPVFLGVQLVRVLVAEGVRSSPVSSFCSRWVSSSGFGPVFGGPASSPVLPACLSGRSLLVGREPMT